MSQSTVLVGAGIVNLITAYALARAGYQVTVYDRGPDPRSDAEWSAYGCTRGGGDGRMFTLTEADSYNYRSRDSDGSSNDLLGRRVAEHGWKLMERTSGPAEALWAKEFHELPANRAAANNADIFRMSHAAAGGWDRLIADVPRLFDCSTGYRSGILRLYTDESDFEWHLERNRRVGALRRVLSPTRIAADHPALATAVRSGFVTAGMEVVGFTVNIHRFVDRLLTELERAGVRLRFETEVVHIVGLAEGTSEAEGLRLADGRTVRAEHYVVSPGAYSNDLLIGTRSHNRIHGVLGVWLTIPNHQSLLTNSVKLGRSGHIAEETNVTVVGPGDATLALGAGYGWTGLDPSNIDTAQLNSLHQALTDTAARLFPEGYSRAVADDSLDQSRRFCVRPWTSSCLGVFEIVRSTDGVLVITGGHNTGGFAQAPAVAQAVVAALRGEPHPMHDAYHPSRHRF